MDSASGQSHPQAIAWGLWGALAPRTNKTSTATNSLPQSLSSLHSSSCPLLTMLTRFLTATSGFMSTLAGLAPQHEDTPCSSVSAFNLFSFRVSLQDISISRYRLTFRKEIIKLRCNLSLCLQSKPEGRAETCGYPCSPSLKATCSPPWGLYTPLGWRRAKIWYEVTVFRSAIGKHPPPRWRPGDQSYLTQKSKLEDPCMVRPCHLWEQEEPCVVGEREESGEKRSSQGTSKNKGSWYKEQSLAW